MTTPVLVGYPDFGRQRSSPDLTLLNLDGTVLAAQFVSDNLSASQMPFINIHIFAQATSTRLTVVWRTAQTGGVIIGTDVIVTASNGTFHGAIPVRGAFAEFQIDLGAYPNSVIATITSLSDPSSSHNDSAGGNTLISLDPTVIGAGATATVNATDTRAGWIYWRAIIEASPSTRIRLLAVNFSGTTKLLDYCNQDLASTGRLLLAPALPLRVVAFNNDASARDFYCSVAHHPFFT